MYSYLTEASKVFDVLNKEEKVPWLFPWIEGSTGFEVNRQLVEQVLLRLTTLQLRSDNPMMR